MMQEFPPLLSIPLIRENRSSCSPTTLHFDSFFIRDLASVAAFEPL